MASAILRLVNTDSAKLEACTKASCLCSPGPAEGRNRRRAGEARLDAEGLLNGLCWCFGGLPASKRGRNLLLVRGVLNNCT